MLFRSDREAPPGPAQRDHVPLRGLPGMEDAGRIGGVEREYGVEGMEASRHGERTGYEGRIWDGKRMETGWAGWMEVMEGG